MGRIVTKIKYKEDPVGDGSYVERTLYLENNTVCDYFGVYNDNGDLLFSWYATDDKNLADQLLKLFKKYPEDDPEVEYARKELDDILESKRITGKHE